MPTQNRGFATVPTTSPDYSGIHATAHNTLATALDARHAVEAETANGAIAIKEGLSIITKASIDVLTLAKPIAGLPAAGGDDGKVLRILSATAFAHTVTTPAAGINGAFTTLTFTGAVGNTVELVAYGGTWYVAQNFNATIS